jgi:hypothetical protein
MNVRCAGDECRIVIANDTILRDSPYSVWDVLRHEMGGRGLGKEEENVTEGTLSEPADLVDDTKAPYVRPLGNLVLLFAQAEMAWLALVAELTGCTENEAQRFLEMKAPDVKQKIIPHAQASGIEGFDFQELSTGIENYYCDRKHRNQLMHGDWYVSLLRDVGGIRTRRLPRKKNADVIWGDSTPEDVWELARRFHEYRYLFSSHAHKLLQRKSPCVSESDVSSDGQEDEGSLLRNTFKK